MINRVEVNETNEMIEKENLDVRTITIGISLLDLSMQIWKIVRRKSTVRSSRRQRILLQQEMRLKGNLVFQS